MVVVVAGVGVGVVAVVVVGVEAVVVVGVEVGVVVGVEVGVVVVVEVGVVVVTCLLCTKAKPVLVKGLCTACRQKVWDALHNPGRPEHCEMCGLPSTLQVCAQCDPVTRVPVSWDRCDDAEYAA